MNGEDSFPSSTNPDARAEGKGEKDNEMSGHRSPLARSKGIYKRERKGEGGGKKRIEALSSLRGVGLAEKARKRVGMEKASNICSFRREHRGEEKKGVNTREDRGWGGGDKNVAFFSFIIVQNKRGGGAAPW